MLHELIIIWFGWLQNWGYWGVFILMALESTIVPVPSEIVMPPAAYWASQGHMSLFGVIAAGTLGSCLGSVISFWIFKFIGSRVIASKRFSLIFNPDKIAAAASIVKNHGAVGVFISRLLPVVRHLISMPAGLFNMPFTKFLIATFVGSGLWCTILAFWGQRVIGSHPELLNSPEEMMSVIKKEFLSFAVAILALGILYFFVQTKILRKQTAPAKN